MPTYIVTRHAGALVWLRRHFGEPNLRALRCAEDAPVRAGDRVVGVLPISWAARICALGAEAHVLTFDVPAELRGQELSADDLDALGARLVRYEVRIV